MVQKRINELEPGKLRAYNELLERLPRPRLFDSCHLTFNDRQRDLQEKISQKESKLHEVGSPDFSSFLSQS
jgi:hypothetical protein